MNMQYGYFNIDFIGNKLQEIESDVCFLSMKQYCQSHSGLLYNITFMELDIETFLLFYKRYKSL